MKRVVVHSKITIVGFLAIACNAPPAPPEAPIVMVVTDGDNGDGTPIGDACHRLRELGCPEGTPNSRGKTCYQNLTVAARYAPMGSDGGKIDLFPSACISAAISIAAVRECGDNHTIRVRCRLNGEMP